MKEKVNYEGIWLDMNEAANFVEGQNNDAQKIAPENSLIPTMTFQPGNRSPNVKSLQVDAYHDGKADDPLMKEYNYHNLFGYLQTRETAKIYNEGTDASRTFIIARSTFAGSGRWVSHWLGDNHSTFDSMKTTTAGIMLFNTFGYSLVGGDICGFMDQTTNELCSRWTAVGAFYPFARNHNGKGEDSQEPYVFEEPFKTQMITSIERRYQAIRYLYNWMWRANQYGGTVFRPQSAEFPDDQNAYANPEENFMIGDALKFAVAYENTDKKSFYFPSGSLWIDLFNPDISYAGGSNHEIDTSLEKGINVFLRQQKIIQWNEPAKPETGSLNTGHLENTKQGLKMF